MAGKGGKGSGDIVLGKLACGILLVLGLVFIVVGLTYCRGAIERPADEFRFSFVPLFVLVSIGLVLMLGGTIGWMHMEIAAHSREMLAAFNEMKDGVKGEETAKEPKKDD
ncbi:MAG: hypothetical protein AB1696_06680 [Planctomycetota bacterium]